MTTAQRLALILKSARDTMRKDKGLNGELDRLPMLTWILFLKFLDDTERVLEEEATLAGAKFQPVIQAPYRWRDWAGPACRLTGPELLAFINHEEVILPNGVRGQGLLKYLRSLQSHGGAGRRDVVANVFRGVVNRMESGYLLRDVLDRVSGLHFDSSEEIYTLSHLYESMLREMRDAAGDSGEFYTPRPVVKFMVDALDPQIGEVVLDPACGTGGFLVQALQHLQAQCKTVEDRRILQRETLRGQEAKQLPYMLAQMNLLLHGLEFPSIAYGNSLSTKLAEIGDRDRVDIILTNPPFGGEEEPGIKNNFPADMQTSETALLFLQLIMRRLRVSGRPGRAGRAAIVVPNTTLFYPGVAARVRRMMVADHGLHTIVKLPKGVFEPYTDIESNILFLDREKADGRILYYQLLPPEGRKQYTKTQPLRSEELAECLRLIQKRDDTSPDAWFEDCEALLENDSVSLDRYNPKREVLSVRPTTDLLMLLSNEAETLKRRQLEIAAATESIRQCAQHDRVRLRFGDVLLRRRDVVEIEDDELYKRITIRVKGRGITLRDECLGIQIGTKRQFRIEAGQFALSKIDARNGAFGIVPEECHGAIITGNFWTYDVDDQQLLPELLQHFTQSRLFQAFCIKASPGATNRRYLQEDAFLNQEITVPRDPAQQHMLAEALTTLRAEMGLLVKTLGAQLEVPSELLLSSLDTAFPSEHTPDELDHLLRLGSGESDSPA
ncbi:N-6 DNA methylase [Sphaerimonospora sp. CA-214678]|uniref:class I SAM-dependent DNA methyltransferase n=1 Tax=Sphaerimonospora sp. CA-214678 TaxID=3240029 RepID=UPI003D90E8E8